MEEEKKAPVSVEDMILSFIGILTRMGWEYMGLIANDVTGGIHKDMDQAKLAIDTVDLLFEKIKERLNQDDIRTIERTIDDLKINYITKLRERGE